MDRLIERYFADHNLQLLRGSCEYKQLQSNKHKWRIKQSNPNRY